MNEKFKYQLYKLSIVASHIISISIAFYVAVLVDKNNDESYGFFTFFIVWFVVHYALARIILERYLFLSLEKEYGLSLEFSNMRVYVRYQRKEEIFEVGELNEIEIVTTDEGPWNEDVWCLFYLKDSDQPLIVPQGAKGFNKLFDIVDCLNPKANQELLFLAMCSTDNARFEIWKRE